MADTSLPRQDEFSIVTEQRSDAVVVRLVGAIHMEECDQLQSELIQLIEQPANPIVLDLSELTFICSLGLGALIAAYSRAEDKSVLRVVAPGPNIRALFEVTKLVKLFPPYDSVEDAIAKS